MTEDRIDQGSDALRSDPDNADAVRNDLAKQAERGIEKALRGDQSGGSDNHPEQDPAEGSRDVIERDLARTDNPGGSEISDNAGHKVARSTAGAEAVEPSPGDRIR